MQNVANGYNHGCGAPVQNAHGQQAQSSHGNGGSKCANFGKFMEQANKEQAHNEQQTAGKQEAPPAQQQEAHQPPAQQHEARQPQQHEEHQPQHGQPHSPPAHGAVAIRPVYLQPTQIVQVVRPVYLQPMQVVQVARPIYLHGANLHHGHHAHHAHHASHGGIGQASDTIEKLFAALYKKFKQAAHEKKSSASDIEAAADSFIEKMKAMSKSSKESSPIKKILEEFWEMVKNDKEVDTAGMLSKIKEIADEEAKDNGAAEQSEVA